MIYNTIIDNAIIALFTHNISVIDSTDVAEYIEQIYNETQKVSEDISREHILARLNKIRQYRQIYLDLQKLPFIKQRTQEWFNLRKDRLTASDLADAVKGGTTSLTLAKKKANIIKDKTNYNFIPALKWGTMFEPMASRCYSQANNNIYIHDFGLICDKTNQHFGASPDGINDLGIMIEIKCPYSREIIDGFIPPKYKMQIQGQLAVCELEECDYIECDFRTYESLEEYLQELGNARTNHGIIAEYLTSAGASGEYYYLYSDANLTPEEAVEDIQKKINNETLHNAKLIPWKLNNMNVQRVKFDAEEWVQTVPKINDFWAQVENYRLCPPAEPVVKKLKFIDDDDE